MTSILAALAIQSSFPGDYTKDFLELISAFDQYGAYVHSDGIDLKALKLIQAPKGYTLPPCY